MADVLPRLELIRPSGIPLESIDKFIINPTGLPIQIETLNLLGIPPKKIWIGEDPIHIKAKELIIPAVTGSIWYMSKWVCDFLRQQFLPLAQQNQTHAVNKYPEKIYICRESQYRRVINEPEIIAALTEQGFEIVRLESLSLLEQVALFAGAKVVISPHGSGLTYIVFCQPGTKVLELFPSTYIVRFYWKLSSFLNLDYYYLIAEPMNQPENLPQELSNPPQ
jgi:capsular polysaccharide biosynthesis protein